MRKKPISARIDSEVLEYIRACHHPVNTLINTLLLEWKKKRQAKEILLFEDKDGTYKFKKLKEKHTEDNNQCCKNCIYNDRTNECNKHIKHPWDKKIFSCIYWEKKKERQ